jgi:hypothetical protein
MRARYFFILAVTVLLSVLSVSCKQSKTNTNKTNTKETEEIKKSVPVVLVWSDSLDKALRDRAFKAAAITTRVLGKKLHLLVKKEGPEYAVEFCSKEAMRLTDSVSNAMGLNIRRLAKKYRNPDNETLGKDSLIFKKYIIDWLAHQPLNEQIIINKRGNPVYYNPIRVKHFCLTCHGEPGKTMNPDLAEKIKKHYPEDKATGFKEGQLRGMWVITFPQYTVKKQ